VPTDAGEEERGDKVSRCVRRLRRRADQVDALGRGRPGLRVALVNMRRLLLEHLLDRIVQVLHLRRVGAPLLRRPRGERRKKASVKGQPCKWPMRRRTSTARRFFLSRNGLSAFL
jgi:hypothetical protein